MTPAILCATIPCTRPSLVRCEGCQEAYCTEHYGPGSSTYCNSCYRRLVDEGETP